MRPRLALNTTVVGAVILEVVMSKAENMVIVPLVLLCLVVVFFYLDCLLVDKSVYDTTRKEVNVLILVVSFPSHAVVTPQGSMLLWCRGLLLVAPMLCMLLSRIESPIVFLIIVVISLYYSTDVSSDALSTTTQRDDRLLIKSGSIIVTTDQSLLKLVVIAHEVIIQGALVRFQAS